MKLKIIFFALIFPTMIFSQQHFFGFIRDYDTKSALEYTIVKYNDGNTLTDSKGYFSFSSKSKTLQLDINYIGYKSKSIRFKIDTITNGNLGIIHLKQNLKYLDDIVITSGKYKKNIKDITISLETIKPKFIENNNISVFDDLLDKIPGVSLIDGQVNIRGGSGFSYGAGARVLILINNMPALQFDSALPNWENIPVETVAKIEVMKGAGSTLYGSAAMNGIINVLPIYAKKEPTVRIKTFYTMYDSPKDKAKKWWDSSPYRIGFSSLYAKKFNKLDVVSSFYINLSDSYNRNTFSNYSRVTLNLDYHFTENLKIGINTNYNKGQGLTFFYWQNANEGAYQADSVAYSARDKKVLLVDPYISYLTKNGAKHRLQARYYYVSNLISLDKYDISKSLYGEYQFQKDFSKYDFVITAGAVAINSYTNAELYGDTVFIAQNQAAYLQIEKKLWNKLNIVAGARYERNTVSGPKVINGENIIDKYKPESKPIFRFGLNYKLAKQSNVRASWGQGFRYPTIAEKFSNAFEGDLVLLPNLDLKSETGFTAELGFRQGWKLSNLRGYSDISVFQSEYQNMIEFTLKFNKNLYFTSDNLSNTIIKGVELTSGFSGKIKNVNLNFVGGYYYIDPKYKEFTKEIKGKSSVDYNILKYRYKHTFKFDFEAEYNNFSFGIGSSYNSFMEAIDKIFELKFTGLPKDIKEYRQNHNTGTNIFRSRIAYRYRKIKAQINIDNLFNKEYSIRPGLLEAPRSFTFSLNFLMN